MCTNCFRIGLAVPVELGGQHILAYPAGAEDAVASAGSLLNDASFPASSSLLQCVVRQLLYLLVI